MCVEHEIFFQNVKTMIIMMWILMGCELSCDYAPGRQFAFEEEEQKKLGGTKMYKEACLTQ